MTKILKNRYEIIRILGRDGTGSVYKVADRMNKRRIFAAKELRWEMLPPGKIGEMLSLFREEAQILLRLSHPNLPRVHDYFSLPGSHYIVMDYVKGHTLEHILEARRGRPVEEQLALSWTLQICRAMHYLSVQKPPVVFRDLKPSNIMIDKNGKVQLIDFGIARYLKEGRTEDTYIYGTPGYAAPEQYGTGQTDIRSDIYSLGATLYHCLAGRNPLLDAPEFPGPLALNPKLNRGTARIIRTALEQDPRRRYQTALDMKQAVQSVLRNIEAFPSGLESVIHAETGKSITLPWWRKTSWVSVPKMALGCNGTTGTLSSDDRWLHPRPRAFNHGSSQLLFRVDNVKLRMGKEYRPRIIIRTDAGVLQPQLSFKRQLPWLLIDAGLIAAAAAGMLMMR